MAVIISRRSSYCPNFATAPTDPPSFNYERGEHLSIAIWGGVEATVWREASASAA